MMSPKHARSSFLLSLALVLASAPSWAWNCAMPRAAQGKDLLACARACAASDALLSEGGKLAGLGKGSCMRGALSLGKLGLLSARVLAPSFLPAFACAVPSAAAEPQVAELPAISGRAPPLPLSSQFLLALPQGLAPPVLG